MPPAPGRLRLLVPFLLLLLLLRRRLSLRRLLVFLHWVWVGWNPEAGYRRPPQQPAAEGIESGGYKRVRHGQEKKP